ncbi:MAG: tRNA (adenosine(37)-N6)-threonylcarbamoyltransferase complex dimerization subunit type 1 TsaB [Gammaproteobacteria bacterium]
MKLLAIDTATEACSAAVLYGDEIISRYQLAPRQHAELILPMVDDLLAEAGMKLKDMDALAFGRGPGAFTGVRIATGVIQGLAFGVDLPVIPVSTLAALAQGMSSDHQYTISVIDARMHEIYWCAYQVDDAGLVSPLVDETISSAEALTLPDNNSYFGIGSGWRSYHSILEDKFRNNLTGFDGERYPHARDIIPLARREFESGRTVAAENVLPVYLRNKVTG